MKPIPLHPAAFAAILLAAGCSAPSDNNAQAGADTGVENALSFNEATPGENASEAEAAVPPPPAAPAGASTQDAAPLVQARQVATEIDSAPDVERVPFQGGWAWRRHGQTIRTSSADGRRISYFRPGESTPFFVQQGERSFAYAGGRAQRAYDRGGHGAPVPPDRQSEARQLANQSRHDRDVAQQAPAAPHQDGRQDRPGRNGPQDRDHGGQQAQPPATGNAVAEPSGRDHDRNARGDRRRDRSTDDDQANRMDRRGR